MAKGGNIKLAWSRALSREPPNVMLIRDAYGRYYASFVVVVVPIPLPATTDDVGVDLGLDRLAVTSDGEIAPNARHLRSRVHRRNILIEGRMVPAGLADTRNACGADVRPPLAVAVGDEAGTRRGAP